MELRPEPTIAVDARNGGLGDLLAARLPDMCPSDDREGDGQLVVVLQDAHRHDWQRSGSIVAAASDAIVVEVGLPVWRPGGAAGYVATHGAAKVNVEAAVDRLLGRPSGFRPGGRAAAGGDATKRAGAEGFRPAS